MLSEAIQKLKTEIEGSKNNPYIQVVGQFLLQHLETNPQDAEKILNADKTIGKSLDEMRKVAEKNKVGNVAVLTDAEGFSVVLKYFGIDCAAAAVPVAPAAPVVTSPTRSGSNFDVKLEDFL